MFNPRPRIEAVAITPRESCWVIDDALIEPERFVDLATQQRASFEEQPHNAYPGCELRVPDVVSHALANFFSTHLRERLGARRVLRTTSRLALTTRAADALQPRQSICHVDRLEAAPGQCIAASVLYLFGNESLGETSFFVPTRPIEEIVALIAASATLDAAAFQARFGIAPGYMVESNAWFQRVATVPARFNRLVVYNGAIFHSGDIRHPDALTTEPGSGRLTLNGFFVCSRPLAA